MLGEGPLIKTVGSVSEDKTNKVEMRTLPPPLLFWCGMAEKYQRTRLVFVRR